MACFALLINFSCIIVIFYHTFGFTPFTVLLGFFFLWIFYSAVHFMSLNLMWFRLVILIYIVFKLKYIWFQLWFENFNLDFALVMRLHLNFEMMPSLNLIWSACDQPFWSYWYVNLSVSDVHSKVILVHENEEFLSLFFIDMRKSHMISYFFLVNHVFSFDVLLRCVWSHYKVISINRKSFFTHFDVKVHVSLYI